MKSKITLLTSLLLILYFSAFAGEVNITGKQTAASYSESTITIQDNSELHLTSTTPLTNSTVDLTTEDSWLYFENLTPSEVVNNWLQYVTVNGVAAKKNTNVKVAIYIQGAVVIPHASSFQPLEVFTEQNFEGTSKKYGVAYHKTLGDMSGKIRSFKLKKGYMVTLATGSNGSGYSRVFIADTKDVEFAVMPPELDESIVFMRVFNWDWVSKKGWCGTGAGGRTDGEKTKSTWFYTWSADNYSTDNIEYVPIRQKAGWPGYDQINALNEVTHVLGYNEPDHAEQSNLTVDQAIADWPRIYESGLRVGSPATTDFNWLYSFMDKCKALNYRVDYVVVHAYWGGKSPQNWYNDLKRVYERTGRPIWIKEWNNGANWTTEGGWNTRAYNEQNATKQYNDLKGILQVMDTASFIERYSIYNWVEDCRAILLNGSFTKAGEYYRDNHSVMAYKPAYEVISTWINKDPKITSSSMNTTRTTFTINVSNPNGLLSTALLLEKKAEGEGYQLVDSILDVTKTRLEIDVPEDAKGRTAYRIRYFCKDGKYTNYTSEVGYGFTPASEIISENYTFGNNDWNPLYFSQKPEVAPIAIVGPPTGNNSSTFTTQRINSLSTSGFTFRYYPWTYQSSTTFKADETSSFFIHPEGTFNWGGLKAVCQSISSINGTWKTITFPEAFEEVPVVFATQCSAINSTPTSIRIKNVTKEGFDIIIKKEATVTTTVSNEKVSYIAVTPGTGVVNNHPVTVGTVNSVGTSGIRASTVDWNASLTNPAFFSNIQTTTDERGTEIRLRSITGDKALIYLQPDNSDKKAVSATTETAGWMVIDLGKFMGTKEININNNDFCVYPNPAVDYIYFNNPDGIKFRGEIYNMFGQIVKSFVTESNCTGVAELSSGYYMVKIGI